MVQECLLECQSSSDLGCDNIPGSDLRFLDSRNSSSDKLYLCYFLHRHLSFRRAEIEALSSLWGYDRLSWLPPAGGSFFSPFWYVELQNDELARKIAARSMLIKGFYELWGEGESFEELETELRTFKQQSRSPELHTSSSWRIVVDSWGTTLKLPEQVALINKLAFLDFKGPICLNNAEVVYRLIITADNIRNGLPRETTPVRWYFGREVATCNRKVISQYALPERLYIGPTSMDTEMAFVICNMAKIKAGSLVYDPFVGTGSILVAASHLGAQTIGADIDMRVIRDGKLGANGSMHNNWSNFEQYKLNRPVGLLRLDAHLPAFRERIDGWLDAIVCDPPYGVRAAGRRSICLSENGSLTRTGQRRAEMEAAGAWFPPTQIYGLTECLQDLLDFAARHLTLGGRLVYFLPAAPDMCEGDNVPKHPALKFVANCEQVLTRRYSRRLITMEKCKQFSAEDIVDPLSSEIEENLAQLHETVYEAKEEQPQKQKYRGKVC